MAAGADTGATTKTWSSTSGELGEVIPAREERRLILYKMYKKETRKTWK